MKTNFFLCCLTFSAVTEIGETVYFKLNLTELGWQTNHAEYFVLARNNISHPIAKIQNAAAHSECYRDLSFLGSVRCTDFNVSFIETKVVSITIRVVRKSMTGNYIFYAFYSGVNHNMSFVQISVHIKGKTLLLVRFHLESVRFAKQCFSFHNRKWTGILGFSCA